MVETKKIEENLFSGKIRPLHWLLVFLGIVSLRLFLDNLVAHSASISFKLEMDLHNFLFFGLLFMLIWLFLSLILGLRPSRLSFLMIWACLLIDLPPILDLIKTGGSVYIGPYIYTSLKELKVEYLTVFGNLPTGMLYFGTKITFLMASLGIFFLVWLKTKNWIKGFLGLWGAYSLFFFMASFPSWLTFANSFFRGSEKISQIGSVQIFQFMSQVEVFSLAVANFEYGHIYNLSLIYFPLILILSIILFLLSESERLLAVLRNIRLPQCFYHLGLLFVGMGLGYLAYPENLTFNLFSFFAVLSLCGAVLLAWKASVVVNDIYDQAIDKVSNPSRPLPNKIFEIKDYAEFGIICFILSLIGGLVIGAKFAFLLLIYQILAFFYSAPPFRLKRIPFLATLVSSWASLTIVFLGFFLFSGENNLEGLSWRIIFLLMLVLIFSLPLKDFKDIEGDRRARVWTIPVIFGEEMGRIIIGGGIFLSFVASVFFLNERKLFFWAIIFGALSFLIVVSEKIKARRLIWWVFPCVFIYGLILVKISLLS